MLFQKNSPFQLIIPHPDLNKKDRKSYFVALDSIIKSAKVKVFCKILNFFVEIVCKYINKVNINISTSEDAFSINTV